LDEIKELRQAKDAEKKQIQSVLAWKDKSVGELEAQLAGCRAEVETYTAQVASLRKEISNILEDKEALRRELDVALSVRPTGFFREATGTLYSLRCVSPFNVIPISASQNQERGVEGLRSELRSAEMIIDDMKAQHTNWVSCCGIFLLCRGCGLQQQHLLTWCRWLQMRQAQRREADLEAITAELTESIAAKQRRIESLEASALHSGDSSQVNDLEMHR